MRYAMIMAGGAGKRLWPLSRLQRPKQMIPLLDGKSLLEIAVERLDGLFEKENIYVITNAQYAEQAAAALPNIPRENIIGEPEGRDTANAIALGAELIAGRDEDAVMAVFTADQVIRPVKQFAEAVETACQAAENEPDALLTFGIRPTWPHTGLGYIHAAEPVAEGVMEVVGFKEKPGRQIARQYVESGEYFWNSGMFVWKLSAIRQAIAKFLPDSAEKLTPVSKFVADGADYTQLLAETYPTLEKISIDFAVMEKAPKVRVVELNCEWLDVGSWPAMEDVNELDECGNAVVAEQAVLLDSSRNVVVSEDDHLLAVLGMDDCIIVHSPDATLVCNKTDSQQLKKMVELIEQKYGRKFI